MSSLKGSLVLAGFIRVLLKSRPNRIHIDIQICIYKRRLIIRMGSCDCEVENSHSLLPASWRPRKATGVIQSKSEGLRSGELTV